MPKLIPALLLLMASLVAAEEGRVYVQSDPPGADISLLVDGVGKPLSQKTPSMIGITQGNQTIVVSKDGYVPRQININVASHITKTGIVKLEVQTSKVDILYEDGWTVFVNNKPINDVEGRLAKTPCTVEIQAKATVTIAKAGYQDMPIQIENGICKNLQVPERGQSRLLDQTLPKNDSTVVPQGPKLATYPESVLSRFQMDSEQHWNMLPAQVLVVSSKDGLDTQINLDGSDKIFVWPHPNDRWSINGTTKFTHKGGGNLHKGILEMRLCYKIGESERRAIEGLITNEKGPLHLLANDGNYSDNSGQIRVKIFYVK